MQRSCRERGNAAVNSGSVPLAARPQVGLSGGSQARRGRGHLPAPQRSLHTAVLGPASCLRSGHGATSEHGWLQKCRPSCRAARAYAPSPGRGGVCWASTEALQGKAGRLSGSAGCIVLKQKAGLRTVPPRCPCGMLGHGGQGPLAPPAQAAAPRAQAAGPRRAYAVPAALSRCCVVDKPGSVTARHIATPAVLASWQDSSAAVPAVQRRRAVSSPARRAR